MKCCMIEVVYYSETMTQMRSMYSVAQGFAKQSRSHLGSFRHCSLDIYEKVKVIFTACLSVSERHVLSPLGCVKLPEHVSCSHASNLQFFKDSSCACVCGGCVYVCVGGRGELLWTAGILSLCVSLLHLFLFFSLLLKC